MNTFERKGYGRIYVDSVDNIEKVKGIIRAMDEYEYKYLTDDLFAPFEAYPKVVYVHKFSDMDIDVITAMCWLNGVKIWCFNSGHTPFPVAYKPVTY